MWLSITLALLISYSVATCRAKEHTSQHMKVEESGRSEPSPSFVFEHRHFFGYDISAQRNVPAAFHARDSNDVIHAYSNTAKPATFVLRANSNPEHATSPLRDQSQPETQSQLSHHDQSDLPIEPNTTDKQTIVNLAKMTSDAYLFDPGEPSWLNTSLGFNFTSRFGWLDDGLRGHVFATEDNSTVIVAFKGTTITLGPGNDVSNRDRLNDNKLFSCCCGAQNPWYYSPVCNCSTGQFQCDSECLTQSVLQNDSYYSAAMFVMGWVQSLYPESAFWVVGHSLGGSLASLVGMTHNIPAVTFEAPPERLPAERMGLIAAHDMVRDGGKRAIAHHFGNTADPIFVSSCKGLFSTCAFWGFNFDSKCFTGRKCVYDTVKDKGWRVDILNHRINYVIENVLEVYDDVPKCQIDEGCEDCAEWTFT